MLLVGLTGGIASGKSLVSRVFKDLGAQVIDADRIVHDLLEPGQQAWQEVVDHFGRGIQLPDGMIDRRKVGEIVFADAGERAWLNRCLHPRVFDVFRARVLQLQSRQPEAVIVFDAALLIETGFHRKMNRTVVVYAEVEQQIERLMRRDSLTREQALARIASQRPLAEKRGQADYVVDNTGTREAAERRAREIFQLLRRDAEKN